MVLLNCMKEVYSLIFLMAMAALRNVRGIYCAKHEGRIDLFLSSFTCCAVVSVSMHVSVCLCMCVCSGTLCLLVQGLE